MAITDLWKKKERPAGERQRSDDRSIFPVSKQPEASAEPPKKEPNRRRSEVLKLRLTSEELAYLTEQANVAGISRTDLIMAAVRGRPVIVLPGGNQILQELIHEGNNLNQSVKALHLAEKAESDQERKSRIDMTCTSLDANSIILGALYNELAALIENWEIHTTQIMQKTKEKDNADIYLQSE